MIEIIHIFRCYDSTEGPTDIINGEFLFPKSNPNLSQTSRCGSSRQIKYIFICISIFQPFAPRNHIDTSYDMPYNN